MRIVHVFKDAYPPLVAGITRYMYMLANASVDRGHQVEIIVAGARRTRQEELRPGLVVTRCREYGRILSTPLSASLVSRSRSLSADVVHAHMPNPLGELGLIRSEVPRVVTFHARLGRQGFLYPVYGPLQRRILEGSARILVGSPAMAADPFLEPLSGKVRVMPYPVEERLVSKESQERSPGWDEGSLQLLFVGRLVYYKGLDVLLDSLEGLPDVQLTIVGDGPLGATIEQRVRQSQDLQGRVHLLGGISDADLVKQYGSHDAFVAPSISQAESFGIAMAEGLANGLPAISSALGTGTDWVNVDGLTGMVIPPNDASALGQAIVRMKDPDTRKRLSEGARRVAIERYSPEPHFDAIDRIYEEVRRP